MYFVRILGNASVNLDFFVIYKESKINFADFLFRLQYLTNEQLFATISPFTYSNSKSNNFNKIKIKSKNLRSGFKFFDIDM